MIQENLLLQKTPDTILKGESAVVGLEVNNAKIAYIINFRIVQNNRDINIELICRSIPQQQNFTYLGTNINSQNSISPEMSRVQTVNRARSLRLKDNIKSSKTEVLQNSN